MNKELEEKLINCGCKITPIRATILDFLRKENQPVSVREMDKKLKEIDRATIYRALKIFSSLGIVNCETIDSKKLYCLNSTPHHHIICSECGKIEKVSCQHNFTGIKNFSNIEHTLTLKGICKDCANKINS